MRQSTGERAQHIALITELMCAISLQGEKSFSGRAALICTTHEPPREWDLRALSLLIPDFNIFHLSKALSLIKNTAVN